LHFIVPAPVQGQSRAGVVPQPGFAAHTPAEQLIPAPQITRGESGTLPVALHTDVPVEHSVWPVLHTLPSGVHTVPALHATQPPLLHTRSDPQLVPLVRLVPRSLHVGIPDEQSSAPLWQGAAVGLQSAFATQTTHEPLLHTCPLPQSDPSAALPDTAHTDAPVMHEVLPALHVVPGGTQS
jgi:hypothetical protein